MESGPAMVTLILGGARSGKSRYAQRLAALAAQEKDVVFLATAQVYDDQMRVKIERHRKDRPASWKTVEVPFDLDVAITKHGQPNTFLLVDCLTTFTTNLMMAENGNEDAIFKRIDRVRSALATTAASVAVVSNEVGCGVVPSYPSGFQFRDLLGEINQRIAQIAGNVILMIAGCPLMLKGNTLQQ